MTDQQRKEIHRALKAAKQYLRKPGRYDKEQCICYALCTALENEKCTYFGQNEAIMMISTRLGHHAYLTQWARANCTNGAPIDDYTAQEFRHRWLDALIEEFSK